MEFMLQLFLERTSCLKSVLKIDITRRVKNQSSISESKLNQAVCDCDKVLRVGGDFAESIN